MCIFRGKEKLLQVLYNYALSWDLLLSLSRTVLFNFSKFTYNCISVYVGREGSICQREQKPRRLMGERIKARVLNS